MFADGSCQAFAPTSGDRQLTVFLDAGHGGIDPGAGTTQTGRTIDEGVLTLPVELDVMSLLRDDGFRVVVPARPTPQSYDWAPPMSPGASSP